MSDTLFEKIGGEAAVNAAVDIFYRKVLADDRINEFFADVDMDKQAAKQKAFLTMAFGGPNNYSGEDMRIGHAHLVERGLLGRTSPVFYQATLIKIRLIWRSICTLTPYALLLLPVQEATADHIIQLPGKCFAFMKIGSISPI